jgi:hypothetical protein
MGRRIAVPLLPATWGNRLPSEGYDPQMPGYSARLGGQVMSGASSTRRTHDSIMGRIRDDSFGGYSDGQDTGIVRMGRFVEGDIHNWGHIAMSRMTRGGSAAMGTTTGSARDPMFYRWHGYVDWLFQQYKRNLGSSSATDLGFAGVQVTGARMITEAGQNLARRHQGRGLENNLFTSMTDDTVALGGWARPTRTGQNIQLRYRHMNHLDYRLEVDVTVTQATAAVIRVFLVLPGINIEMDKWLAELTVGTNRLVRRETDAPHLNRRPGQSLRGLQQQLMAGQVSRVPFNWAGCGWPKDLNVPSGTSSGQTWRLLVVASPLLDSDRNAVRNWERAGR